MRLFVKCLSWLMIILLFIFVMAIAGVRVFGIEPFIVATNSMYPVMPQGSMAYTVEDFDLKVGDIITWSQTRDSEGHKVRVTHRIVKIDEKNNTVTTKGDANEKEDINPVEVRDIYGKVKFSVPYLGTIAELVHSKSGIYLCLAYLVLTIVLIFLPSFMKIPKDKKSNKNNNNSNNINNNNFNIENIAP